jgi:hypothetical protein
MPGRRLSSPHVARVRLADGEAGALRMASSFWAAAAMVVSIAATRPSSLARWPLGAGRRDWHGSAAASRLSHPPAASKAILDRLRPTGMPPSRLRTDRILHEAAVTTDPVQLRPGSNSPMTIRGYPSR